jgi:hypothetical protein
VVDGRPRCNVAFPWTIYHFLLPSGTWHMAPGEKQRTHETRRERDENENENKMTGHEATKRKMMRESL